MLVKCILKLLKLLKLSVCGCGLPIHTDSDVILLFYHIHTDSIALYLTSYNIVYDNNPIYIIIRMHWLTHPNRRGLSRALSWPVICRKICLIISCIQLVIVGVPIIFPIDYISTSPNFLLVLHHIVLPGRPYGFPQIGIFRVSVSLTYFVLVCLVLFCHVALILVEARIYKIDAFLLTPRPPRSAYVDYSIEHLSFIKFDDAICIYLKNLFTFLGHILLGVLHFFGVYILLYGWMNGLQVTTGLLLAILLTPALISINIWMKSLTFHQSITRLSFGMLIAAAFCILISITQIHPSPAVLHELTRIRGNKSPGMVALRRLIAIEQLEIIGAKLYCRKDHPVCIAQKKILGQIHLTKIWVNSFITDG